MVHTTQQIEDTIVRAPHQIDGKVVNTKNQIEGLSCTSNNNSDVYHTTNREYAASQDRPNGG